MLLYIKGEGKVSKSQIIKTIITSINLIFYMLGIKANGHYLRQVAFI